MNDGQQAALRCTRIRLPFRSMFHVKRTDGSPGFATHRYAVRPAIRTLAQNGPNSHRRAEGCEVHEYREGPAKRERTRRFVDLTPRSPGATCRVDSAVDIEDSGEQLLGSTSLRRWTAQQKADHQDETLERLTRRISRGRSLEERGSFRTARPHRGSRRGRR